ncbi:MAG: ComF family protein [Sphingomonadaceae bacterium]|nr:ComF family protein [Sphingomonadaceae bacterium]
MEGFPFLRSAIGTVVDYALPPRCPVCGVTTAQDGGFCGDCWQELEHLEAGCAQCGDPTVAGRNVGELCGACIADPPPFDTMRAAVAYGDTSRAIALRLKYGGRVGLAKLIAGAMARQLRGLDNAVITAVPLHRLRLWRRGYNQAALIARALADRSETRLDLALLERKRATPYLRGMSARQRTETVRGAFRVPEHKWSDIRGNVVVVIDDVYTSGATTRACARLLKQRGAAAVHIRTWARVIRGEEAAY